MRCCAAVAPVLTLGENAAAGTLCSPLRVGSRCCTAPCTHQQQDVLRETPHFSARAPRAVFLPSPTHADLFPAVQHLDVPSNILNHSRCFWKRVHTWLCWQLRLLGESVASPQSPREGAAGKQAEGVWEGNETSSNLFALPLLSVIC